MRDVSHKRHLAKTVTWRVIGTIDTIVLSWFITGNPLMGLKIGMAEVVTKMVLYYLHERIWFKINLSKAGVVIQSRKRHFAKSYMEGDISTGKNLIAFNVVERYISNFIDQEIADAQHHEIKIIGIEQKLSVSLDIPGVTLPVVLKGKLDRVDERDGQLRIIDYKTGKVESKNVEIVDWESITSDYDCSKAFQLLCYALMYGDENSFETLESGIISFKNLNAGLLRFATKPNKGSRTKEYSITTETLSLFKEELSRLITEICNPDIPLTEKEV